MQHKHPDVLMVSRDVWDETNGTSSTESNIFQNYDPNALHEIYIETKIPNTRYCNNFFQISEYTLIRRIFNKKINTGKELNFTGEILNDCFKKDAVNEEKVMNFVRHNRSWIFTYAREILWMFNGWKSKELKNYLISKDFDVLFLYGSPLILMNRLHNFVIKQTKKPAILYLMDDVYTYKSCGGNPMDYIYKYFLRLTVKRVVKQCQEIFVVSPKMKREYDAIFNINSKILTKVIDFTKLSFADTKLNVPLRIVYLGQLIYGRYLTLIKLAKTLKQINSNRIKAQLFIYTSNYISKEIREKLEIENCSFIMPAVPYYQVQQIMRESDIVLFVESLNKKYKNLARLSFSTKLTDYFSSSKCIFAIGDRNVAPIEYLKEQDAAIIASSELEIENKLVNLIENPDIIKEYSRKSFECGKRNHNFQYLNEIILKSINNLALQKNCQS